MVDFWKTGAALFAVIVLMLPSCANAFNATYVNGLDTDRFASFSEVGDMRELLLLSYYSQDRKQLPAKFEVFSGNVIVYIETFGAAYELSLQNDSESHAKALENARELKAITAKIGSSGDKTVLLSDNILQLATIATERFIVHEGDYMLKQANDAQSTKDKLGYYDRAIAAMELSEDDVSAASALALKNDLEARYAHDMAEAKKHFAAGDGALYNALGSENMLFGLIAYAEMRRATGELSQARALYAKHVESSELKETDAAIAKLMALESRLSPSVGGFFFWAGGALIIAAVFIVWRLRKWMEDKYDASLGVDIAKYGHEL
jgi:hypothetical protein